MNESEKKMELMATTLQTINKDTTRENGVKPCTNEGNDDRKGEADHKRKEEEREKDSSEAAPLLCIE